MEGKSIIQLFDAVTKEETLREENGNLITNVFKNFIESILKLSNNPFQQAQGFATSWTPWHFAKGIILFDGNLTEDPNQVLPDLGVGCVGHAGSAYAGTDPYRGNFNASESGAISGGYKFVWDFSTNQANGVIKCAGLCTEKGGNVGYKTLSSLRTAGTLTSMDRGDIALTNPTADITEYANAYSGGFSDSKMAGFSPDLTKMYFQLHYSGTISLGTYSAPALQPFMNTLAAVAGTAVTKVLNANETLSLSMINGTLYGLLYNSSTKALYLKTYDPVTLNELTSLTMTNAQTLQANHLTWGMVGNTIYVLSSSAAPKVLYSYNKTTGAYIGSTPCPVNNITYAYNFDDTRMAVAWWNYGGGYYGLEYWLYDGVNFLGPIPTSTPGGVSAGNNGVMQLVRLPGTPIVMLCDNYYNGITLWNGLGVFAMALGSINNLATPVTKTSSSTMKVTYQITW